MDSNRTDARERLFYAATYALAALLGLSLAAHAYVGFYTRYMADDYCTAGTVMTAGLLSTQRHFYVAWSGRFSFTLTVSLFEMLGTGVVPYLPLAALACWLAATTWAVYEFFSPSLGRRPLLISFLLAELIVCATVNDNRGGVYEALYWQTGMLTYLAPLILLTALAGFYGRALRRPGRPAFGAATLPAAAAAAFYAGGFSETTALMQTGAFVLAVAAAIFLADATRRRRLLPPLCAGLAGSVGALALILLAPGNRVRGATLPSHSDWLAVAARAEWNALVHALTEHYPGETFAPRWAVLLLTASLAFFLALRAGRAEGKLRRPRLLWLSASGLFLSFCTFLPASYALSAAPPPRALIVAQLVLVYTLASFGWVAGEAAGAYFVGRQATSWRPFGLTFAALALLALFSFAAPTRRTLSQAPRARALARLWDRYDAEIRARVAGGERDLTVPVAYNIGGTDIMRNDPRWYVNHCLAVYYGAGSVAAVPDREGIMIVNGDSGP
jgi:hypothetical protein